MAHGKYTPANFGNYDLQNPHIYELFVYFALEAAEKTDHYSAKFIMYRVRWETMAKDDQPDEFKVNDGWISHYARKFIDDHPELDGFFEFREIPGGYHVKPPPPPNITEQAALI